MKKRLFLVSVISLIFVLSLSLVLTGCDNAVTVDIVKVAGEEIRYGEDIHTDKEITALVTAEEQLEQFITRGGFNILEILKDDKTKAIINEAKTDKFFENFALICIIQVEGEPVGVSAVKDVKIVNNEIQVTLLRPKSNDGYDLPQVMTSYIYFVQVAKSDIDGISDVRIIKE